MDKKESTINRRTFLSNAAIIGASGAMGSGSLLASCSGGSNENKLTPLRPAGEIYIPDLPDKAIDGKPLKAALIGCGSRGTGAAINFLNSGDGLSIVACADVFGYRMERCRNRLKEDKNIEIPDDMCFLGFDAYKKVCDLPDIDLVLIASPSGFHPEHLKYAIDHDKHVFCEKAACVDPVGYRTFMMAVRQAQTKNLCLVMGTHRHHQRGYVESYRRVQEGYIGRITSATVYHNQMGMTPVRRIPEWTDMEYMFRGIFHWKWLTGDHVIDQLVHYMDVFTWFSHLKPLSALAFGSRLRETCGDIYDNFSVDFIYEGGVHVHGMTRQIDDCHDQYGEIIQGTKGSFSSMGSAFKIFDLDGNLVWKFDEEAAKAQFAQNDPYTLEHVNLVNHIRSGKVINLGEITATASLACIMARESAYTGKMYTWDEMAQSDLNLMPSASELAQGNVDMSRFTIPVPGSSRPLPNL